MPGAVCHIGYQVFGRAFRIAQKPVDCFDYDFYKVDVFPFVESSDIIGVGYFTFVENQVYGAGVVFNKQPVAYIFSFAVYRKWFAVAYVVYEQRYQLFGKLVWTVIVRAVCNKVGIP